MTRTNGLGFAQELTGRAEIEPERFFEQLRVSDLPTGLNSREEGTPLTIFQCCSVQSIWSDRRRRTCWRGQSPVGHRRRGGGRRCKLARCPIPNHSVLNSSEG